jgi:hypothetical protein
MRRTVNKREHRLSILLSSKELANLERLARNDGVTMADVVRMFIRRTAIAVKCVEPMAQQNG